MLEGGTICPSVPFAPHNEDDDDDNKHSCTTERRRRTSSFPRKRVALRLATCDGAAAVLLCAALRCFGLLCTALRCVALFCRAPASAGDDLLARVLGIPRAFIRSRWSANCKLSSCKCIEVTEAMLSRCMVDRTSPSRLYRLYPKDPHNSKRV